jgi:putative flavoprotein involved in K+ transport
MSKHLSDRGIDHVVLERGEVAHSWRTERWNSLRLLTPNWQSRLPGFAYSGPDPDGYMTMPEVVAYVQAYADRIDAPVETGTTVTRVSRSGDGYLVATDRETWACRTLVIASGACNVPVLPALAERLPQIASLTPFQYRAPAQLSASGVMIVGASATGVQLAREIRASGREVLLCVGEHVRLPRLYRGRDIKWWMEATGMMRSMTSIAFDVCHPCSLLERPSAQRSTSTRFAPRVSRLSASLSLSMARRQNSRARWRTAARSPTSR